MSTAKSVLRIGAGIGLLVTGAVLTWLLACGAALVYGPAEAEPTCKSNSVCEERNRP